MTSDSPKDRAQRVLNGIKQTSNDSDDIRVSARQKLNPLIAFFEAMSDGISSVNPEFEIEEIEADQLMFGNYSTTFYLRNARHEAHAIELYYGRSMGGGEPYINISGLDRDAYDRIVNEPGKDLTFPQRSYDVKVRTPEQMSLALRELERILGAYFKL